MFSSYGKVEDAILQNKPSDETITSKYPHLFPEDEIEVS